MISAVIKFVLHGYLVLFGLNMIVVMARFHQLFGFLFAANLLVFWDWRDKVDFLLISWLKVHVLILIWHSSVISWQVFRICHYYCFGFLMTWDGRVLGIIKLCHWILISLIQFWSAMFLDYICHYNLIRICLVPIRFGYDFLFRVL